MQDIAVALSGSGFRFPCYFGALQAIEDLQYNIIGISGTSGGGIVACCYAAGFTPQELLQQTLAAPLYKLGKANLWSILRLRAWNSGKALEDWLSSLLHEQTFRQTAIPVWIVASNLNTTSGFVFSKFDTPDIQLAVAARATCSIPFFYPPVILGDKFLVDGGLCNDLPAGSIKQRRLSLTLSELPQNCLRLAIPIRDEISLLTATNWNLLKMAPKLLNTVLYSNSDEQIHDMPDIKVARITCASRYTLNAQLTAADITAMYKLGYESVKHTLTTQ